MAHGECSSRRIKIEARRQMALELAKRGASYRRIAEAMRGEEGISPTYCHMQAWKDVKAALAEMREKTATLAVEYRNISQARLDAMLEVVMPLALNGDYYAIDRVIKIEAQRAQLLGLNAPAQLSVTHLQGMWNELQSKSTDELLRELGYEGPPGEVDPGRDDHEEPGTARDTDPEAVGIAGEEGG